MKSQTETVHFVVEGEFLTNLARQLWADEGEPGKALNILTAAFPTMKRSDIFAIIVGEKKLIGDSSKGCELVTDDATESSFGNSLSLEVVLSHFKEKLEDREDWIQMATGNTFKTASPEGLVAIPSRRRKAYRDGKITLDGIPYKKIDTYIPESIRTLKSDPIPLDTVPDPKPKPKYTIDYLHGWLSPDGKFYSCEYMGHIRLADLLGFDEPQLEKQQWIKIQSGDCVAPESGYPSQSQRDLLFDWYRARNEELPWWLKEEEKK